MRIQEQYQQMIVDAVKSVESFINPTAYENTYAKDTMPAPTNNQEGAHHYIKQEDLQKLMNTPIHQ